MWLRTRFFNGHNFRLSLTRCTFSSCQKQTQCHMARLNYHPEITTTTPLHNCLVLTCAYTRRRVIRNDRNAWSTWSMLITLMAGLPAIPSVVSSSSARLRSHVCFLSVCWSAKTTPLSCTVIAGLLRPYNIEWIDSLS